MKPRCSGGIGKLVAGEKGHQKNKSPDGEQCSLECCGRRAGAETPTWRVRTRTRESPEAGRLAVSFPRLVLDRRRAPAPATPQRCVAPRSRASLTWTSASLTAAHARSEPQEFDPMAPATPGVDGI